LWFAASQLAMAVNGVWTLLNPDAYEVLGNVGWIWAVATIVLSAFLVRYSIAMKRRGLLCYVLSYKASEREQPRGFNI